MLCVFGAGHGQVQHALRVQLSVIPLQVGQHPACAQVQWQPGVGAYGLGSIQRHLFIIVFYFQRLSRRGE